jgi:hypothetical protein
MVAGRCFFQKNLWGKPVRRSETGVRRPDGGTMLYGRETLRRAAARVSIWNRFPKPQGSACGYGKHGLR